MKERNTERRIREEKEKKKKKQKKRKKRMKKRNEAGKEEEEGGGGRTKSKSSLSIFSSVRSINGTLGSPGSKFYLRMAKAFHL